MTDLRLTVSSEPVPSVEYKQSRRTHTYLPKSIRLPPPIAGHYVKFHPVMGDPLPAISGRRILHFFADYVRLRRTSSDRPPKMISADYRERRARYAYSRSRSRERCAAQVAGER